MSYATDRADATYRRVQRSRIWESAEPADACRALDIDVVPHELPDGMYGQSIMSNRCATIFLADAIDDPFRQYVLSHELGHCVMHPTESTPFMRRSMHGGFIPTIEREANEFAFRYLLKQLDHETLLRMSRTDILDYFGVPQEYERFIIY
ncbi:ImmA/IrrE family metallo-endopeptidase [Lacticaseibacillus daqingensis]|uniref:ImmA/IrrE family metallo-endopeptidase n=1 Tax=Lacticaseibacillus daqingensis TaxID=2486014 RepID=UPI000F78FB9B|nr:ImmA/IrrE family metallo-endopeptidase [Lacticaseibacillus daqingensis]